MFNLNPEQDCETIERLIANGYCRKNANHKLDLDKLR